MMFFSDGTLSSVTYVLLLGITCLTVLCDLTKGSTEFSGCEFFWYFVDKCVFQTCVRPVRSMCASCTFTHTNTSESHLTNASLRVVENLWFPKQLDEVSVWHQLFPSGRPMPPACCSTHTQMFTS